MKGPMHRELQQLLATATSESESLVAVNVDIRRFSNFSASVESVQVALYLRRAYMRILETYLTDADFFKLTGDGILLVFRFASGEELGSILRHVLTNCRRLLREFPTIAEGDDLVYFPVPEALGIGVSRGAGSRISARGKIIDYAGITLNTATRLMSVARPRGIVLDATIPAKMIPRALRAELRQDSVYLAGIAEADPMPVWHTPDVVISPQLRTPIAARWETIRIVKALREWRRGPRTLLQELPSKPDYPKELDVRISARPRNSPEMTRRVKAFKVAYRLEGEKPTLVLDKDEVVEHAAAAGSLVASPVEVRVRYQTQGVQRE